MAPLSIMTTGINILTKSFGLFSTTSLARCTCAITAATPFSTTSGGPPKRPLTPYIRFFKQQQPQVKRQYPDLKVTELTKKIAARWGELTSEQKRPFEQASLAEKIQYKAIMAKYQAQLTPEQSAANTEEKRQKIARRNSIRRKRELNILGKPKRKRSGFNIFVAEHFEEARGVTNMDKMTTMTEDWKKLNFSQKQVYQQLAEDDEVRYNNEIKMWEKHMAEIGRQDLIRLKERTTVASPAKSKVTKSKVAAKKTPAATKKNMTAKKT